MAETENAPSWLNELDRKEAEWAASYLSKRWPEGLKAKPSPTPPMLYHSLAESIHELEKYAAGVKLIGKRMGNTPCADQPGIHRCGSSCSISLAFCVGNRVSTSLR